MDPSATSVVLPFASIGLADLPRVGGKGANLGELGRAGFPVPPGFCVTTEAYRQFLASAPADVLAPLDGLAPEVGAVRAAGARVREALGKVSVPASIDAEVRAAWAALDADWPWAVRSSATAEDLPDASFAGQQDTYLNVRGADDVLDAVRRCWISLFTDRAILYRIEHGFPHHLVELSVVVQRQVLPDSAGILFTADPITSDRTIVSIDAGFGLGEGLVSGRVSADLFRVHKPSGAIVTRRIADKALAIRPLAAGGTQEVALSGVERTRASLTDPQVLALVALGRRIEAHYGRPQDVEWCLVGDELFVVQSRPITTLHDLPSPPPDPASRARGVHVYVSWNHVQGMTDPIPELSRSLILLANPLGKGGRPVTDTPYMSAAGGRLYHDATDLLRLPLLGPRIARVAEQSDPLMGRALADVVRRPEFRSGARVRDAVGMAWALFVRSAPVTARTVGHLLVGEPEAKAERAAERLEATLEGWRGRARAASAGAPRLRVVREMVLAILPDIDATLPLIFASIAANQTVRAISSRPDLVAALLRATPRNVLTEKDERLAEIAELARPHADAVALARAAPEGDAAALLARLAHHAELRDALAAWFDRFGDRAPGEVDASRPRYRDDPRPLLKAMAATLEGPADAFSQQQAAFAVEAEAAVGALGEAASTGLLGPIRGRVVRWLARVGRQLFAVRELPKFYWLRVLGLARRVFVDEGQRLAAAGRLERADDVWFLTLDELIRVADGDLAPVAAVSERRAAHRRASSSEAARVLTSDGEVVVARHASEGAPPGALVGVSASPGVAEGVARVIRDPGAETLEPGEILVAAYTDPGWTPLFPRAGGLVMEVGGQMTHGSVVAREYGIPAVVCVPGATHQIRTGDRVRVDGDQGWVERLGSGTSAATSAAVDSIAAAEATAQPTNPTEP